MSKKMIKTMAVLVLCMAVIAGLYARFAGLGDRQLAVDEYYFIQSVGFILDHGVPRFPTGGYYNRGLLMQYLTALSVFLLGSQGLAFRLPAVLFSLAAVVMAYPYARRHIPTIPAVAVCAALLVSSWHIEFARFVRMYSAFQFLTLAFLVSLAAARHTRVWYLRYLPHLLVVLATLTHVVGILLAPLLLILVVDANRRDRVRLIVAALVAAFIARLYHLIPFRNLEVVDRFPPDIALLLKGWQDQKGSFRLPGLPLGMLRAPAFPFWSVSDQAQVNLVVIWMALLVVVGALVLWRRWNKSITNVDIVLATLFLSCATHTLMLAVILFTILLCRYRIHRFELHPVRCYVALGASAMVAGAWLLYAAANLDQLGYVEGGPRVLGLLRRTFFGWPDFYLSLIAPWLGELPVLSALALIAIAWQLTTKLALPVRSILFSPLFVLLYFVMCLGTLSQLYVTTRHSFFIFPVVLVIVAQTSVEVVGRIVTKAPPKGNELLSSAMAALCFLTAFALTRDFNAKHIRYVNTADVAFRLGEYERYRSTWYPRDDFQSPADFLDRVSDEKLPSKIIVVDQPPVSYYLKREHAVYYDRTDTRFINVSRVRGTVDAWSNKPLLSTHDDLRQYTAGASTIWLIRTTNEERRPFKVEDVWPDVCGISTEYTSLDGRLEVTRVVLAPLRPDHLSVGTK